MKKVLLLIAMLVCMALATNGFAVQPADDVDTIALWHMDTWNLWNVLDLAWDDMSAGYGRAVNYLLLNQNYGAGNMYSDPCHPGIIVHDVTDGNALSFNGHQQAYNVAASWKSYAAFGVDMEFQAQSVTGTQTLIEATGTWSVSLSGSDVVLTIYTSGATRTLTVTGGAHLGTWQHIVASCDAAGNASLRVDAGSPVTSSSLAVKLQTADICLGNTKGSSTKWFTGYIDEVKVTAPGWEASRALSDATGVWGLWHMDSAPDSNVADDDSVVINRNNDIRLGDIDFGYAAASKPTLVSPGVTGTGSALHFDGIQQEASTKINWPANYNKFNVDFWFKPEASTYLGSEILIQATSAWVIGISNITGGNADLGITIYTAGDARLINVNDSIIYNVWHHLILDVAETGHIVVTLDGTAISTTDGLPVLQTASTVSFGNKQGPTYVRWYQGSIDEVKITGSNVYVPHAPTAPAKDSPLTKALWHFDAINTAYNFQDDDANHTTRNADLGRYAVGAKLNDNTSYPSCVDPTVAGIGYPSGNSAFANCAYFDAISGANCYVANTLMNIDGNDISVEGWLYLPADFKLNQGIFSQAAHTYYWFDRWGQVALAAIETATTATDANSKVQFNATTWDQNSTPVGGKVRYLTYTFSNTSSPSPYAWNHVKFTCINKTISLYINGILAQSSAVAGGLGNPSKTTTRIGARYNPQNYFYGYVDDVMIGKSTLKCGDSGYNAMDFNKDCMVNFKDVQALAADWLFTNTYSGNSGSSNYPTLVEQKWADTGNYNIPKTTVVPTIDGVFHDAEWADARTIEMISPTLTTAPNRGSLHGLPAPAGTDYRLFWYVKWDNTYLYIAGVVDDNDVNTGTGYDEPQVIFNLNNDPTHTSWLYTIFCINFANSGVLNSNGGPALSNSTMARVNTSNRYVYEAKFKWSDLDLGTGYTPAVGNKHGFGFFCQDHNLGTTRTHVLCDFNCDAAGGLSNNANYNTITLVNSIDCHEKLQSTKDLNTDCIVNFKDFGSFAQQWLNCSDGSGVACH